MTEKKNIPKEKNAKVVKNSVDKIYAENVICSQSGVREINAGRAEIEQSGIGYLRAQNVTQTKCGNAVIYAKQLKTDSVKSLVTICDNIEGNVTTVFDKKGAAIAGVAMALTLVVLRIFRRLFR